MRINLMEKRITVETKEQVRLYKISVERRGYFDGPRGSNFHYRMHIFFF